MFKPFQVIFAKSEPEIIQRTNVWANIISKSDIHGFSLILNDNDTYIRIDPTRAWHVHFRDEDDSRWFLVASETPRRLESNAPHRRPCS